MGAKITPKDLEKFYINVDELCAEIFDFSNKKDYSETSDEEIPAEP